MTDPGIAKRALRTEVGRHRTERSREDRLGVEDALAERLLTLVLDRGARTVACYLSTPVEPGTRRFVADALARGVRVLLPVSGADGRLRWVDVDHDTPEVTGRHGMPEPLGTPRGADALAEADLILVPAAAVDVDGFRLGWGRGYYDRALAAPGLAPAFALVHDDEIVDAVPREPHDLPVAGAITPTRTLLFPGTAGPTR